MLLIKTGAVTEAIHCTSMVWMWVCVCYEMYTVFDRGKQMFSLQTIYDIYATVAVASTTILHAQNVCVHLWIAAAITIHVNFCNEILNTFSFNQKVQKKPANKTLFDGWARMAFCLFVGWSFL